MSPHGKSSTTEWVGGDARGCLPSSFYSRECGIHAVLTSVTFPDLPEVTPPHPLGCPCTTKWFSNSECPRKQIIVIRKLGASHNPSVGSQALEKEQTGKKYVHEIPMCSHSLSTGSSEARRNAKDTWNKKPVSRCCERNSVKGQRGRNTKWLSTFCSCRLPQMSLAFCNFLS